MASKPAHSLNEVKKLVKAKRCGNCGNKTMARKPVHTIQWKDFKSLELLKPLELFTCSNCNEIAFSATEATLIDRAAESTLQQVVAHFIKQILNTHKCTQGEVARRLGITETHLSHLKNGTKIIGFQTFNFLKTLALGRDAFEKANPTIPIKHMMAG